MPSQKQFIEMTRFLKYGRSSRNFQIHAWRALFFLLIVFVGTFSTNTVAQAISQGATASKINPLNTAAEGNGIASQGYTLEYKNMISASGSNATGVIGDGLPIAMIPAIATVESVSNLSAASTLTDNSITYLFAPPPIITEGNSVAVIMSENGIPMPFGLTLHATDANSNPLTWSILTPANHGTAGVPAGPTNVAAVSYTPSVNFIGADSFVVQVSNGSLTDTITVYVTLVPSPGVTAINSVADTGDGQVLENERTNVDITQLLVVFNNDMNANEAQTASNYSLVQNDATYITIDSILYSNQTKTATLHVNGGIALPSGFYTLTVKSTLHDTYGFALPANFIRKFVVDKTPPVIVTGGVAGQPGDIILTNNNAYTVHFTAITVTFNEDVSNAGGGAEIDDVSNPLNYLLLRAGPNAIYDTPNCSAFVANGKVPLGDDLRIPTGPVTYTNHGGSGPFVATVTVNGGSPLSSDTYRLLVCGTTTIVDLVGNPLNNGADSVLTFSIFDPVVIPTTGFAPGRVTALSAQTVSYTHSNLWLEIPRLGVKMDIVGVPQTGNGLWDVSWLGSDAGWLNGSAFPTWNGNSVITGHVVDADGKAGPFRYVNTLGYGDQVVIHAWGAAYMYEVRSVLQVGPGSTGQMLKHEKLPWVTLVTCRGYDPLTDTYKYRVLVRAVLVRVE